MKGTGSLLDQLEELVNEVIALSNRLACTAEDVRFAQSFHPPSVAAELTESRKIMLDLSARLAAMEGFLAAGSETASAPLEQNPPAMSPREAVSLRPATPEDSIAEVPAISLERKWEEADARFSGLTQLIEAAWRAENASDAARNLSDLALQFHRQKKFDEAERLYQHALEFREKFFGPDHASVATDRNNLAALLQEQGRLEEAAVLLRQSSSITQKASAPDHPEMAQGQSDPASLSFDQENVPEEELLLDEILAVVEEEKEKHKQTTLPEEKASLETATKAPEGKVGMQECVEEAQADGNPGTETTLAAPDRTDEHPVKTGETEPIRKPAERKSAEANVSKQPSNLPTASFVIFEPIQRRNPAIPAWAWSAVALVALSVCALLVRKATDKPVQVEIRQNAPTQPSVGSVSGPATDLTAGPTTGTLKLPGLLPGTRVRVDGVSHNLAVDGSFETTLSEGSHNVELTRPGYEPKSLSVELKAGQTVTIWGREVTVDSRINASSGG